MNVEKTQALIIGGGPSGLSVAYALQGDTLILEKESRVGGLCRSIHHGGGVFDIGGHSFHTPHPEVHQLVHELMGGRLFKQRRDARVYSHGTLIPYPFQKFYDQLPDPEVVRACEDGLREVERTDGPPPRNFEEFLTRRFGRGIAEHFMLPYNRKLWARDISGISCEWTSERVAEPKGKKEKFENQGGKRKPLQADTLVAYPETGGYEEIYRAFVPHVPRLELESEVVAVDPRRKLALTADGRQFSWKFLVSTMPLPILVRVIQDIPDEIREMADRLDYLSLRVELLLTRRPLKTEIQRIYTGDPEIPAHKIAFNHNSSDHLRNRPRHAIMAEVSVGPTKEVRVREIAPRTVSFLCDVGVLRSPDDVHWAGHLDVHYGYPVYTHERPELVAGIKEWLARHDMYTLGRFGEWEYVNSDKCVKKGLDLGRELLDKYAPLVPELSARRASA